MKRKYIYLILATIVSLVACEDKEEPIIDNEGKLPKPTASFTYEVVDPADPFTIKLKNGSSNFAVSRWAFDDDSTSSDASPTHTFLYTGEFNVKLVSLNEEGYWAQYEETIKILPTDLVQIQTSTSGGQLNLSYETTMTVGQTEWFVKQSDGGFQSVSTDDNVSLAIPTGEFRDAYVTVKTPKGSAIRLDMQLMSTGIVKDVTTFDNEFSVLKDNDGGKEAGEGSLKLIDNSIDTKFLIFGIDQIGGPFHWQFEYVQPQIVNGYTMTTGNDAEGRDPKNWDMLASNDGENWVTLDTKDDILFPNTGGPTNNGRKVTYTYTFDNGTPYYYYRLQVRSVRSGTLFQMSEFRMLQLPQ